MRQNARITIVGKPIKKMFNNEKENSAIVKEKKSFENKIFLCRSCKYLKNALRWTKR
jgi:hypothetical protein